MSDPTDIDGGRAYFVLLALHVTYILFAGTSKGLGVLLPTLKEHFDTHTWLVGSIISLVMTTMDFSCVLSQRVPSRYIVTISGTCVAAGLCLSSIAQTVFQFGIFLGLVTGVGYGFTVIIMEIELARHFHRKYACANGIATAGSSVGLFIMAPLMQVLLDTYGWKGALLILGGLSFNLTACGCLVRPQASLSKKDSNDDCRTTDSQDELETLDAADQDSAPRKPSCSCCLTCRSGFSRLTKAADLAIFKELPFIVVVIVVSCIRFVFSAWTIYFVPHAQDMGFSKVQAAMFVTITAVGNFIGKASHGYIVDRRLITRRVMIGLSTSVTALIFFLDHWMTTEVVMIIACLVNGIALGVAGSMIQVFLKKTVGVERLANSLGWTNVISGFVRLGAGFFPGWIYDQTMSYYFSFVMIGCVSAICPTVLILHYLICRRPRQGSYDLIFT
ncbi:monocarboxylate transporter 12-like isoform X2 [Acanthaster planci]|uniref:Monocarboxylate transporter 12-like isoform X2 n=1 Tax=Acanthaster planci TaxID=133434 RepID=A0A8B7YNJ9_ACAPL|nr:monocarboxylate transporter 12-like isoform X2 [Acanthaster planci]